ncbi:MAG: FkbM family methyltransferase [Leptospirales bacterium]
MSDALSADGSYEAWLLKYLELASEYFGPEKDAVDIGANAGIITVILASLQSKGRVLAFEPVSFLCDRLKQNLKKNNITNAIVERAIVDDHDGATRKIEIPEGAVGGASVAGELSGLQIRVERHPDHKNQLGAAIYEPHTVVHTESVTTLRLDSYLRERHLDLDIKIIKIDVEHWELPVLAGAVNTIREHDPVVLIEFNVQIRSMAVERYGCELYRTLSNQFAYIFCIDRLSCKLLPLHSYAELRGAMLTGHFVEDLLCFNSDGFLEFLGPHIAAKRFSTYNAGRLTLSRNGCGAIVSFSHYPDDWCCGHDFFLYAQSSKTGRIRLRFTNPGPRGIVRLLIASRGQLAELDLRREAVTRDFDLSAGEDTLIYVFVEQIFSASRFFGNDDPRELGVQIAVEEI